MTKSTYDGHICASKQMYFYTIQIEKVLSKPDAYI